MTLDNFEKLKTRADSEFDCPQMKISWGKIKFNTVACKKLRDKGFDRYDVYINADERLVAMVGTKTEKTGRKLTSGGCVVNRDMRPYFPMLQKIKHGYELYPEVMTTDYKEDKDKLIFEIPKDKLDELEG